MAIPDYQDCMLPLLELLADGQEYQLRAVTRLLADRLGLTDADREQLLPSGSQPVIANRVAWAKTYLKKAGLIVQPTRGVVRITDDGRAALAKKPGRIDNEFLRRYPGSPSSTAARPRPRPTANRPGTPPRRRRRWRHHTRHCTTPWPTSY